MPTRIEKIILRARDILADPTAERWSDERLIRLIDEAQRDIAHQTRILKAEATIPLIIGQAVYSLPDDVFMITRASFDDCQITLLTHDQMDEMAAKEVSSDYRNYGDTERRHGYSTNYHYRRMCWETAEGADVEHLIYDRRNMSEIRVYPIPSDGLADQQYTFTTDDPDYAGAELLGVVVESDNYTLDSVYGVTVELFDPQVQIETSTGSVPFGVVTEVYEYDANLKIWYIKTTAVIDDVNDELEIPGMFDVAIKHYIVWQAFRDDFDTRYREKAEDSAQAYGRELAIVKEVESKNGVRMPQRRTSYRGAFE